MRPLTRALCLGALLLAPISAWPSIALDTATGRVSGTHLAGGPLTALTLPPFSTAGAGRVLFLSVRIWRDSAVDDITVSGGGLTWTALGRAVTGPRNSEVKIFGAVAPAQLVAQAMTVSWKAGTADVWIAATLSAYTGGDLTTPWGAAVTGGSTTLRVTTATANALVLFAGIDLSDPTKEAAPGSTLAHLVDDGATTYWDGYRDAPAAGVYAVGVTDRTNGNVFRQVAIELRAGTGGILPDPTTTGTTTTGTGTTGTGTTDPAATGTTTTGTTTTGTTTTGTTTTGTTTTGTTTTGTGTTGTGTTTLGTTTLGTGATGSTTDPTTTGTTTGTQTTDPTATATTTTGTVTTDPTATATTTTGTGTTDPTAAGTTTTGTATTDPTATGTTTPTSGTAATGTGSLVLDAATGRASAIHLTGGPLASLDLPPFSTAGAGRVLFLSVRVWRNSGTDDLTVSGGGLQWAALGRAVTGPNNSEVKVFGAVAPAQLVGQVVTVSWSTGTADVYIAATLSAYSGADLVSPWGAPVAGTATTLRVTTTTANARVLFAGIDLTDPTKTAASGSTLAHRVDDGQTSYWDGYADAPAAGEYTVGVGDQSSTYVFRQIALELRTAGVAAGTGTGTTDPTTTGTTTTGGATTDPTTTGTTTTGGATTDPTTTGTTTTGGATTDPTTTGTTTTGTDPAPAPGITLDTATGRVSARHLMGGPASTLSLPPFSTAGAGRVLFLSVRVWRNSGADDITVSGGGLTWTALGRAVTSANNSEVKVFGAIAPAQLVAQVMTVSWASGTADVWMAATLSAYAGADLTSPWGAAVTGSSVTLGVTTATANARVLFAGIDLSDPTKSATAGSVLADLVDDGESSYWDGYADAPTPGTYAVGVGDRSSDWVLRQVALELRAAASGTAGGGTTDGGTSGGGTSGGSTGPTPVRTTGVSFPVAVSAEGRHLQAADGQPFQIRGDAPWDLLTLTTTAATTYLDARVAQGFNTILVALMEHRDWAGGGYIPRTCALGGACASGPLPFTRTVGGAPYTGAADTADLASYDPAFFDAVDTILDAAAARGFLVALSPFYLGYLAPSSTTPSPQNEGWSAEAASNSLTSCAAFGAFVGNRYKDRPNLLWVWVNDTDLVAGSAQEACSRAVMEAARSAGAVQPYTAHLKRGQNAMDSVGASSTGTWQLDAAYVKPTIAGGTPFTQGRNAAAAGPAFVIEDYYENSWSTTRASLRYAAWGDLLSTTGGYVFGNDPVWLFGAGWLSSLDTPGATDTAAAWAAADAYRWWTLVPTTALCTAGCGAEATNDWVPQAISTTATSAVLYLPPAHAGAVTVDMSRFAGPVTASWRDPVSGATTPAGSYANAGTLAFLPPGTNSVAATDWALLFEPYAGP